MGSTAGSEAEVESAPSRPQVGPQSAPSQPQVAILQLCQTAKTLIELMIAIGRRDRKRFREQFIKPLLDLRLLQMTIPAKPRSRLQQYRTTGAGREAVARESG